MRKWKIVLVVLAIAAVIILLVAAQVMAGAKMRKTKELIGGEQQANTDSTKNYWLLNNDMQAESRAGAAQAKEQIKNGFNIVKLITKIIG